MNKYDVTITETLQKTFQIEAKSLEDAKQIASQNYYRADEGYVLDADCLTEMNIDGKAVEQNLEISIYQINCDRDTDKLAFESYECLTNELGYSEVKPEIYDKVFDGTVNATDLEDVYRMFNIDMPEEYNGRSLSVSDIVEVRNSENIENGFYYCDAIGFQKVDFDTSRVGQEMKPETMRVVMLEPGQFARVVDIEANLKGMQQAVGGDIEPFYCFDEEVCIVCCDEGKINGMPLNRAVYDTDNKMLDVIAGPCFICDCSTSNFKSLSDEQIKKYREQFKYPENFIRINNEIKALKYKPEKSQER